MVYAYKTSNLIYKWEFMQALSESNIQCPYCGESITVIIDCSVETQEYIEDCQVCCRPITFKVSVDGEDEPLISIFRDDDT